jgi:hypothetical protein
MRWLMVSIVLGACSEPEPATVSRAIELHAVSVGDQSLAGLRAWLDGKPIGETKSDGVLRATLRGGPRQRVRLSWACPAAYEPATGERELVLDSVTAQGLRPPPLKLDARCSALEISAALVVRARGAPPQGIPIRVRNEVVARTDEDGLAHLVLRARRGSALTVALDTSAYPRLIPESPVETFQLGSDDTILLLDRALSTPRIKPKRPAKKPEPLDKPFRIE